jgi:DNA repair photolyase
MPHERILTSLYGVMALLLEQSIFLLISTKSRIPEKFLRLFAEHPGRVHVQLGMTTVDDRVRKLLEPKAAGVADRLSTLRDLVSYGVRAEIRMDPLVPELTDTQESFVPLCEEIRRAGVENATASYLFLRRANHGRLAVSHEDWSFSEVSKRLYTHNIDEYCGGGAIRIPAPAYRKEKYAQLTEIANDHGITLSLCRCKNPDLTVGRCHPEPPKDGPRPTQDKLFPE